MYQTLQNTPVTIDLTLQALSTGWSLTGNNAIHEVCNAGVMTLQGYPLTAGTNYVYTYRINSISSGYVQARLGTSPGIANTTTGFKSETVMALGDSPLLSFYSNADCNIDILTITEQLVIPTTTEIRNTISYSEITNKWVSFYSYIPEIGVALFTDLYSFKGGDLYKHEHGNGSRNMFYGVQYDSIINFVENKNATIVKTYETLSYQANELLITSIGGIITSLGQISDLIEADFLQYTLKSGVVSVNVYDKDGLYNAYFMRDKGTDIIDGDFLKGNYIIIKLKTSNPASLLQLFTVSIASAKSSNGIR